MDIKIDAALVEKIASLARLDPGPEERKRLEADLDRILGYVKMIDELDLSGVEPATSGIEQRNPLREDEVRPSLDRDELLRSSPESAGGFFKVPKIIETEAPEI